MASHLHPRGYGSTDKGGWGRTLLPDVKRDGSVDLVNVSHVSGTPGLVAGSVTSSSQRHIIIHSVTSSYTVSHHHTQCHIIIHGGVQSLCLCPVYGSIDRTQTQTGHIHRQDTDTEGNLKALT